MRLYSRTGAAAVVDGDARFEPNEDGSFDLPEDLAERLHGFHIGGRPMWETDIERQNRLIREELERRKDPATLLAAVQQLVSAAQATAPVQAPAKPEPAEPKAPAKPTRARKTAASQ